MLFFTFSPFWVSFLWQYFQNIISLVIPALVTSSSSIFSYKTIYFSESAAKVMIELLGTYTEDNASQARDDAHKYVLMLKLFLFVFNITQKIILEQ